MGTIKDDGDEFHRDETLGAQIRRDMHNNDSKYDAEPINKQDDGVIEKSAKKFLKIKLPIWLIVIAIAAFGFFRFYSYLTTDEPVNLRPIVTNAKELKISLTMCNEKVDELKLNVRDEEKRLEKKFEEEEKVLQVKVSIERKDCNK